MPQRPAIGERPHQAGGLSQSPPFSFIVLIFIDFYRVSIFRIPFSKSRSVLVRHCRLAAISLWAMANLILLPEWLTVRLPASIVTTAYSWLVSAHLVRRKRGTD
jgi:hypothetical protein